MSIVNARQYLAAVAKKQHIEKMLDEGTKEFSGYGLELFQSGMRTNLERLAAAIREYETGLGYTALASYGAATGRIQVDYIVVHGGRALPDTSFANLTSPSVAMHGCVGINLGINFGPVEKKLELPANALSLFPAGPRSLYFGSAADDENVAY
jgi:hypothetical protein